MSSLSDPAALVVRDTPACSQWLEDLEKCFSWDYLEIVDLETLSPRGFEAECNKS